MFRALQFIFIYVILSGFQITVQADQLFVPGTYEFTFPGLSGNEPVNLTDARAWRDWLLEHDFAVDRCGFNPAKGTIIIEVNSELKLQEAVEAGFTVVQILLMKQRDVVEPPQSAYFDPDEIESFLQQIAIDYSDITQLIIVGYTFEGRVIRGIEISDNPGVIEDEPAIQFNGQHHARELVTSHVVMDIVNTLTNGYGVDPNVTQWVNNYKTVCVPMVNPDGVQHVFDVNNLWRRNRQVYQDCTGVDLNRNYPYLWGPGCGSSGDCNDIYRGPSAVSELETQAMIALASNFHFVMATSYHSSGRFIDYPYACSDGTLETLMPEHEVVDSMMHGVADAIFDVDGIIYDVFSPVPAGGVNGDDTSWYYAHQGVYSFIIEVGEYFEPAFSDVAGIVERNRGGWTYMYERLGQARIDIHVQDQCSTEPLEAEVTLMNFVYDSGEWPRYTSMPFGRWTYLVVENRTYHVQVSLEGYLIEDVEVFVSNEPVSVEINLIPDILCGKAEIPAVSTWGIVVLVLLLLTIGTVLIHHQQFLRRT